MTLHVYRHWRLTDTVLTLAQNSYASVQLKANFNRKVVFAGL